MRVGKKPKVQCEYCKREDLPCDGGLPGCLQCQTKGYECQYESASKFNVLQSKIEKNLQDMERTVEKTKNINATKKGVHDRPSHFENNLPQSNFSTTVIRQIEPQDPIILDVFFREIYVTLVLMHIEGAEKWWRQKFSRSWLLLNSITAITTPYIDLKPGQKRDNSLGMAFYQRAELAWTTQTETDPIISVFGLLLMARYALASGIVRSGLLYLTSAYQVARMAGFNRENSNPQFTPFMTELSKRLWMTLVAHDVLMSSTNGRNLVCGEQESELTFPRKYTSPPLDEARASMQMLLSTSTSTFIHVPKNVSLETYYWLMMKIMNKVTCEEFAIKPLPGKSYRSLVIDRSLRFVVNELNTYYPLDVEVDPSTSSLNILIRLVVCKCLVIIWRELILNGLELDQIATTASPRYKQYVECIDTAINLLLRYQQFHQEFHRGHALVGLTIFHCATSSMKIAMRLNTSARHEFTRRFDTLYDMLKVYSKRYEVTELMIVLECLHS
ncbi:hypothetical protein EDD86DRAFT_199118 [Gorgonomyces haynaldii]|nr:hypothetical protein EDD86DRAFT_199118 [Gorgonomyces haynaldii]